MTTAVSRSGPEIIKKLCPGCGATTSFRVEHTARGGTVEVHLHHRHQAPCGRPCFESNDVYMQDVLQGRAHHPQQCECVSR